MTGMGGQYHRNIQIAYKLGFRDASYFSRFFKKLTALSPEEFKTEAKKKIAFK